MKIHSPSMSELHAFVTTARLGSFTRAAQVLCLTQGAVSRAISRLEEHFGQPLMKRDAHGISLTAAGRKLLEGSAGPLQAIEDISAQLRQSNSRNQLSLSIVPTLASVWLVPRLPEFHRLHPEITLSFAPYRRDEDFSHDTPHAAILMGTPSQWPAWQCDYIVGRDVVVICHPDRLKLRHAEGRWKEPAELLNEPLLYHSNAPDNWKNWFAAVGVNARPTLTTALDQVSIILRAVTVDMGVAVLQKCLITHELDTGQVVMPFPQTVTLERGYLLCSPQQRKDHPALSAFRQWLLVTANSGVA